MKRIMTREEKIISEAKKYYSGDIKCYNAFLYDTDFADNNPDLSSPWHDASEEPKEGMDILLISKYDWIKDNDGIDKWAYIKDLLPKGV